MPVRCSALRALHLSSVSVRLGSCSSASVDACTVPRHRDAFQLTDWPSGGGCSPFPPESDPIAAARLGLDEEPVPPMALSTANHMWSCTFSILKPLRFFLQEFNPSHCGVRKLCVRSDEDLVAVEFFLSKSLNFSLSQSAMMRILLQLKFFCSGKLHLLGYLKIMVFRRHGKTREQFNEQPKGGEHMEKLRVPPQAVVKDYWRNQSYNALHYQQEQFENDVHRT